ncbi:arsenic resistance N-acetyltransferase ArsN2 [Pseudomonas paeninsulae]|uniref:arsenic resistance N-acetyltransferase ArsN2 n=1 Tax=Pseudomonas paeninsulae TaxID=3110772 RepID=UPI002D78636C|nr:arsenic resistance N-acetyltransferase ArsN2 [Pseudomonas sp. IT1137]
MKATIQAVALSHQVQQLLAACQLPSDDLQDAANNLRLFGCQADGRLVGLVGLQMHGADALLRSLAVADSARGQGLGAELLAYAERQAATHGVQAIYLLTTTAEVFFAQRGYRLSDRATAPPAIAATRQFSGLCPASAAFMRKRLSAGEAWSTAPPVP